MVGGRDAEHAVGNSERFFFESARREDALHQSRGSFGGWDDCGHREGSVYLKCMASLLNAALLVESTEAQFVGSIEVLHVFKSWVLD